MATIKHIASKNANYGDTELYLTFQHDEFSMKPVLDEHGHYVPREEYLFETILCGEDDFAIACMKSNLQYHKNNSRGDIKSHHYIISFDPRDGTDNGLTMERAQSLGMQFCREHFPGHQAIVCTHPDGHNKSGNMHCHIVINSLRIEDVPFLPYMDRPCDTKAGMKHRCTASALRYFRSEVMEMCHRENLYQIDLLNGRKDRITEREYWAKKRGQAKLDRQREELEEVFEEALPVTKYETNKEKLRTAIRNATEICTTFEEFTTMLLESGISVRESRGRFSYLSPDRTKPITSRKLGDDYSKEAIFAKLERNAERMRRAEALLTEEGDHKSPIPSPVMMPTLESPAEEGDQGLTTLVPVMMPKSIKRPASETQHVYQPSPFKTPDSELKKVIDIDAKMAQGYGKGYEVWARGFNLKNRALALVLYHEYGFSSPDDLLQAIREAHGAYEDAGSRLKTIEVTLREKKELRTHLLNYRKAKETAAEYKTIKSQKKKDAFYETHRAELMLREAAEKYFREHGMKHLPKTADLNQEIDALVSEKNACYNTRRDACAREKELRTIKTNLEASLGYELTEEKAKGNSLGKDRVTEKSKVADKDALKEPPRSRRNKTPEL